MTETKAFFIDRQLQMSVGTRELGSPAEYEALLRVEYAGLCGSDLHVMRSGAWVEDSEWPATLGHEICAVVEQAPADGSLRAGDRVVADSRVPCGVCSDCVAGVPDRCTAIRFVGECRPGGFAGLCVLPSSLLHPVPAGLAPETAVLAEPLAVAMHGLSRLSQPAGRVAVIGHGPIGALVQIELRRRFPDAEVTVAEPAPLRAQLARALGAEVAGTAEELPEHRYDTVVDAAGYGASLVDALGLLAPRGQLLLVALGHHPVSIIPAEIVEAGATIAGANAFIDELPGAIAALAAEPSRYAPVVTDTISLDELPSVARTQLSQPEAVKVIVCP
jgi:threonine dehydrogenase-like Zn-dependent dehydrogenase